MVFHKVINKMKETKYKSNKKQLKNMANITSFMINKLNSIKAVEINVTFLVLNFYFECPE